jgi:hypothetical protein
MFIVVGMADQPMLVCPSCADTVLQLAPTGERRQESEGVMPDDQLTMF